MVSFPLASILRSGRTDFNARFAAARRVHPDLDAGAFGEFMATAVNDLAVAVEKVRADRLGEVTMAAFDVALELIGQKLAGPGARTLSIEDGWRRILPKIPLLVASSPGRLIPAVCNAVHQIESRPNARTAQWIEIMERFAPQCVDADMFAKLGQLAAWRAGLAHFRAGAMAAGDGLPEAVTLGALGAMPGSSWVSLRNQLLTNPWFDPANEQKTSPDLRVVAQVGLFKGFGGLFIQPPLVAFSGEHFLVGSGEECWLLTADFFGATFHRATMEEFKVANEGKKLPAGLQIKGSHVVFNGGRFEFPALGEFTSAAANATTLALTSRFTHSIVLAALT